MARHRLTVSFLALSLCFAASAAGAQCGSSLLMEVAVPAVFEGVDPLAGSVARFWEAGLAGSHRSDDGCLTGCTLLSGASCVGGGAGGGGCLALTGVNWLNAVCATPGRLPARTVFLLEQTTADSGGRWAAINVDGNPEDANVDLDAKAAAICGGCSSTLSPYLGGSGRPLISDSSSAGGILTVDLTWETPTPLAQALSNGSDLVKGYGIYYRSSSGAPPPSTGERTGWIRASDTEADGLARSGYSTDTTASVEIPLSGLEENLVFSLGVNFDGDGDADSDPDSIPSAYLSHQSEALIVPSGCGEPNDLLLQSETVNDVRDFVACLTISAGNGFVVGAAGDVTFRAGRSIVLQDGFSVAPGGTFEAVLDASLSN